MSALGIVASEFYDTNRTNTSAYYWGLLGTVAVRVLYVWLFNNTYASVFALILCHTIANTARTNYPGGRSTYELGEGMIAYGIIIIVTIIIICIYGKDLGRKN